VVLASGAQVDPAYTDHVSGEWWTVDFVWKGGLPFVKYQYQNWSGLLMIDTGADDSAFPRPLILALGGVPIGTRAANDIVGDYRVPVWRIPEFAFGPFKFVNFEVTEREAESGLIGLNMFKAGFLALDGPLQELEMKLPSIQYAPLASGNAKK